MDINKIQSTLNETDIAAIESILVNKGVNESDFENILNEIKTESANLEKEYDKEMSIFPEHDFKKLAFENILTEFENEQDTTPTTTETESANTNIVNNNVSTTPITSTNKVNTPSSQENVSSVSASKLSGIPSVNHLSNENQYDSIITEMSNKYDVPFNLIKLVINAESSFNSKATSRSGAMGLMQLMPATAKWLGVNNAYDPKQNIEGGTKYLSYLLKRFDGNLELAVAGYNAGPGNVDKYKGIPPFKETQNYVKKILG